MENIFEIKDPRIDVEKIVSQIKKTIEEKKEKGVYSEEKLKQAEKLRMGDSPSRADFMKQCINTAAALSFIDIDNYRFGIPPFLNRPVLGKLVLLFKSFVRRFLRFHTRGVFHQQIEFNRQLVELVKWLNDRAEGLENEMERLKEEIKNK
jgi:hypothetical protein